MARATPTARTLEFLRREGYLAQVVEHWVPRCRVRRDLFGVIDVVAVREGEILGVQCTTAGNQASRLAKALATPALRAWLAAGGAFEVWGWSLRGPRGKRKAWQVTRRSVTAADLRL